MRVSTTFNGSPNAIASQSCSGYAQYIQQQLLPWPRILCRKRDDPVYKEDAVEIFLRPSEDSLAYFGFELGTTRLSGQ
jgi:hypothetical protein